MKFEIETLSIKIPSSAPSVKKAVEAGFILKDKLLLLSTQHLHKIYTTHFYEKDVYIYLVRNCLIALQEKWKIQRAFTDSKHCTSVAAAYRDSTSKSPGSTVCDITLLFSLH